MLIFAAISMVMLFGMAAFAIDIGQAVYTRRALQASTDAAALAGAQRLPDAVAARATAITYSGVAGGKNVHASHAPVTMVSGYPLTKCLSSIGIPCAAGGGVNAIVVRQQSTVTTLLARVLGVSSLTVYATATATMKGGAPNPVDMFIILDTTASMNSDCSASVAGVSDPTRLDCALAGLRSLLGSMWPCPPSETTCGAVVNGNVAKPLDKIGLMIFPGLAQTSSVVKEMDCTNNVTSSNIANYSASPIYGIVPLSSDYRASTTVGLNGAVSDLVQAVDWGHGNTCASNRYGVESPGGVGTYFADVITKAQAQLVATGRPDIQNTIVLLSDGDSNYTGVSDPCQKAVTAAQNATAAGTKVYSVAYGAGSSGTCTQDSPAISAYTTMQRIASDSTKFFNQPAAGDLTLIFQHIVVDLTRSRLVSDSTP